MMWELPATASTTSPIMPLAQAFYVLGWRPLLTYRLRSVPCAPGRLPFVGNLLAIIRSGDLAEWLEVQTQQLGQAFVVRGRVAYGELELHVHVAHNASLHKAAVAARCPSPAAVLAGQQAGGGADGPLAHPHAAHPPHPAPLAQGETNWAQGVAHGAGAEGVGAAPAGPAASAKGATRPTPATQVFTMLTGENHEMVVRGLLNISPDEHGSKVRVRLWTLLLLRRHVDLNQEAQQRPRRPRPARAHPVPPAPAGLPGTAAARPAPPRCNRQLAPASTHLTFCLPPPNRRAAQFRSVRKAYEAVLLTPSALSHYSEWLETCAGRMTDVFAHYAASGQPVDAVGVFSNMTMDAIGRSIARPWPRLSVRLGAAAWLGRPLRVAVGRGADERELSAQTSSGRLQLCLETPVGPERTHRVTARHALPRARVARRLRCVRAGPAVLHAAGGAGAGVGPRAAGGARAPRRRRRQRPRGRRRDARRQLRRYGYPCA